MSAGSQETQSDTACPAEPLVYFSNPLMSDVESDWSPIHDAAFNGRVLSRQRLIAQGICVNLSTLDRVSPLHGACLQGNTNCAKLLVENGANVNSTTVDGHTALADACAGGHVTCASLLLQHGATPLGTSPSSSPIHLAAAKGQPECIEMLVQHSADVDQHIDTLGSPLHAACSNQQLGSVKKLLQLGADVNRSLAGDSPLHIAARLSSPELVSALLDHGADHLLVNSEGKRPLDLTPPDTLVGRLLREAGGIPSLKQLCRLHIRKTVGKRRLGGIPDLHLPKKLLQYLLYQSEQSTQITSSKQPHTLSFEQSGQQGENLDNLAGQCPSETDYKESLEISES
ncbi:ankyrin repeat and SOCS box protein 9-like [Cyprinodon tularosa]|uniref:ankyrin repeat and SOCS box protein 9-like n=1 Tax=Cyprinodon tularosa TaxID=77115 RepID=UPI0018E261BB|nr:ankyrin repeat and SOCS box protein 9-like [Cyprinodon tularosa]